MGVFVGCGEVGTGSVVPPSRGGRSRSSSSSGGKIRETITPVVELEELLVPVGFGVSVGFVMGPEGRPHGSTVLGRLLFRGGQGASTGYGSNGMTLEVGCPPVLVMLIVIGGRGKMGAVHAPLAGWIRHINPLAYAFARQEQEAERRLTRDQGEADDVAEFAGDCVRELFAEQEARAEEENHADEDQVGFSDENLVDVLDEDWVDV